MESNLKTRVVFEFEYLINELLGIREMSSWAWEDR